jgi:RNA polymerase sigma factor (sigma-70 family)
MFWLIIAKKLEGETLVDAVKKVQNPSSTRKEKNDAFLDLRDTFKGLIEKKIHSVMDEAKSTSERQEIRHHVETSFFQVLTELTPKSAPEIVGYIDHAFKTKINRESIKNLLGKGDIISDIGKYKYRFKNALRDFYKEYKRMPDFNKVDLNDAEDESDDVEKFSKILKATEEQVLEILKLFGQGTIKSLYQEVSGDEDEGALSLIDTLKSNDPLPDQVLEDKELTRILVNEIKKLPDNYQKVLMLYYHPDKPEAEQLTNDEIAAKTGITERNVRHWISEGRRALEKSEILKNLTTASLIRKLVKIAMLRYATTEDLIFEVVAKQCHQ